MYQQVKKVEQILNGYFNQDSFAPVTIESISGGSTAQAYKALVNKKQFFCKFAPAGKFPGMMVKEKIGLQYLKNKNCIAVAEPVAALKTDDVQILILHWVNSGTKTPAFWKTFGQQLAALHQCTNAEFGFTESNYMGGVLQTNTPEKNWITFFTNHRLQPLVNQCLFQKLLNANHVVLFEQLYFKIPELFPNELPALLHGDLWNGNFMCNSAEQPVLIDAAPYFGHRSMDLGMTTLFGGFVPQFYDAYQYYFPLPANYKEQWNVCNLYPLLIHLLLFGKGYLPQIENTLFQFK